MDDASAADTSQPTTNKQHCRSFPGLELPFKRIEGAFNYEFCIGQFFPLVQKGGSL